MGSLVGAITGSTKAAKRQAQATRDAADMATFKPYTVKDSFFGTADFGDRTASYELSPELAQFRDLFYSSALEAIPDPSQQLLFDDIKGAGEDIFRRGVGTDINAMASDIYNQQQNLLAPGRAAEDVALAERLYGSGRTDFGTSLGTGGYINPEQYSSALARQQVNSAMSADAIDKAYARQQSDINFGTGLFGLGSQMGMQPYTDVNSLLGLTGGVENMGMQPLMLGLDIGTRAQPGQQAQSAGYMNAAGIRGAADRANNAMFTNLMMQGAGAFGPQMGSSVSGLFSGFGGGGYQPIRGGSAPNMSYIGG